LVARAIENQAFVVGVNRVGLDGNNITHSGNSMVVGPIGEVLYHSADQESVFQITLNREELETTRTQFPFWKDADFFTIQSNASFL
jgi:omega-amidase